MLIDGLLNHNLSVKMFLTVKLHTNYVYLFNLIMDFILYVAFNGKIVMKKKLQLTINTQSIMYKNTNYT